MQKIDLPIAPTIALQQELRPELPLVLGCREYNDQLLLYKADGPDLALSTAKCNSD